MTPQEFDFTIITRAGLTQKEFAVLSGVSRVTANLWVMGKMNPHRYIKTRTARVLTTLEAAIQSGYLPLPESVPSLERVKEIKTAFKKAYDTATA